uniref:CSON002618 protein n=1 Tax=Culicoides sonorensis TaxID=179676 RepID=A0A336KZG9_CULSO
MRFIFCLIPLLGVVSCLRSTSKLKDGYDSIYHYVQNVSTFIDNKLQTEAITQLEVALRPGAEPNTIVGRLKSVAIPPENITAEEKQLIAEIESPFRIVFTSDGQQAQIYTKKGENRYALKTKDSVLKLLLQNVTQIEGYLEREDTKIRDETCETVINVQKNENEIVFETETKILDCTNKTALSNIISDKSEFKLFYHLDKADKHLIKARSVIDLIYLTSVSARVDTIQDLDFIRFDGLKEDIDETVLIEGHTPEEIDELWKTPAA